MSSSPTDNNISGHVKSGWESVRSVFERHLTDGLNIGASVCIYYQGEYVIILSGGWKDAKCQWKAAGELIRRVDSQLRSCGQFVRDELDKEFYIGVSHSKIKACIAPLIRKEIDRSFSSFRSINPITEKTITCSGTFPLNAPNSDEDIFNDPRMHQAEISAVSGITNVHILARIYARLIADVKEDNETKNCLLSKKTLALATENVTPNGDFSHVMSGDGFGHKGVGGSLAFALTSRQIAFAHVCNQIDLSTLITDVRSTRFFTAIETIL
ncbi:hypothetical protein I4U23_001580 [Adineta vaga]|nr:hypothetical protein I4U23_001580 [Adineta vaga]